ncbi:unnamed protein product [Peniophora sp. CBMAI 1063]|nr:unnamed protein product [Peniophora sp. CBMAI 1063]
MKYYTIAVSDTFHAGLIDALKQMAIEDTNSPTSLEGQAQGPENAKGGAVTVQAFGGSSFAQELQAVREVVDDVVNLTTSLGQDIASLQGMKHEVETLAATMADAEALKDLSEKFGPIQHAQAEAKAVEAMRAELDTIAPKLDATVGYLNDLKHASICVGVAFGIASVYFVLESFGTGLVAVIAFFAFVAAACILTGWRSKRLIRHLFEYV